MAGSGSPPPFALRVAAVAVAKRNFSSSNPIHQSNSVPSDSGPGSDLSSFHFTSNTYEPPPTSFLAQMYYNALSNEELRIKNENFDKKTISSIYGPKALHPGASYKNIFNYARLIAESIIRIPKFQVDSNQKTIAFLVTPSINYVATLLAIWMSGSIAVPLHSSVPANQQKYIIYNSQASLLIMDDFTVSSSEDLLNDNSLMGCSLMNVSNVQVDYENYNDLPFKQQFFASNISEKNNQNALLIYTSGTTGNPKGVLFTHGMLLSQITTLVRAWGYSSSDSFLHVLPLHHTHGILNGLLCPLYAGARIQFVMKFDPQVVDTFFRSGKINVFTAVPTIYTRLVQYYTESKVDLPIPYLESFRLFMCGSAACPISLHRDWTRISGHILLERYGMSEGGMLLSNPLNGERKVGTVGKPLPNVTVRITNKQINERGNETGELELRGPGIFNEYFLNPAATEKEFVLDPQTNLKWFKTGDIVEIDQEGYYSIVGRSSVDIIKSGGNKVGALELEAILLNHTSIAEVAILGLPDNTFGQVIGALIVLKPGTNQENFLSSIKDWCRSRMASYQIPRQIKLLKEMPRNAMGKVNKKSLISAFQ